jgi:putative endonuclease
MGAWVYILRCSDSTYYVATTRSEDPGRRLSEHQLGVYATAYTANRRPVKIVFAEYFERIVEAVALERQIKGWSRAKKEALIERDFDRLKVLSRNRQGNPPVPHGSTGSP